MKENGRPQRPRIAGEIGETGHEANVNQVRDEPIPASHHDQQRRENAARPAEDGEVDDEE
jgi:hypothetical protein